MDELLGKDMGGFLQNLQGAQSKIAEMQKEMAHRKFEAEAGGGLVKVVANGGLEILSVKIDPKAIDPSDPEMLEDLILTAVTRAIKEARDSVANEMTGDLLGGLSGMF